MSGGRSQAGALSQPPQDPAPQVQPQSALSSASLQQIQSQLRFVDLAAYSAAHTPASARHDDDGGFAPPHLGEAVLAAHDAFAACPELGALRVWLDDMRNARGIALAPEHVDLTNGIALLDALRLVAPEVLTCACSMPTNAALSIASDSSWCGICDLAERELDRSGDAGRRNIVRVCAALSRVEWREVGASGNDTIGKVTSMDFSAVDPWALGGFVLLAAVTCDDASEFVRDIQDLAEDTRRHIEALLESAVEALRGAADADEAKKAKKKSKKEARRQQEQTSAEEEKRSSACTDSALEVPSDDNISSLVDPADGSMPPANRIRAQSPPEKPPLQSINSENKQPSYSPKPTPRRNKDKHDKEIASLRRDLADAQQVTRQWTEHAASLERLASSLSAQVDELRAAAAASAKSAPRPGPARRVIDAVTGAGNAAVEKAAGAKSRNLQHENVALRRRVMAGDKKTAALERQLEEYRRDMERAQRRR
jgi:hypothetical protein